MTAPEPADLARQHGAPWAKQSIEDELMKIEQYDFGASEAKPVYRPGWWMFAAAVLLWLLLTLAIVAVL